MEPALRHVVRDLAPEVQGALASLGLETTGDFHHFWPSAQQYYEELESILGQKLDAQEAIRVAVAWTNARRASQNATVALSVEVARERLSSVGGPPRSVVVTPESVPVAPPSNKVRRLTPTGLAAPLHAPLVTYAAQQDPHAKEDAVKQA